MEESINDHKSSTISIYLAPIGAECATTEYPTSVPVNGMILVYTAINFQCRGIANTTLHTKTQSHQGLFRNLASVVFNKKLTLLFKESAVLAVLSPSFEIAKRL